MILLYLPRFAARLLKRALAASPVVVLMGARQTGKSTLAQAEPFLADRLYLTLDLQMPRATVQRYLGLLETSFQLVRLPSYSVNRTKRLVKHPKLYWSDPALAVWLSGADTG